MKTFLDSLKERNNLESVEDKAEMVARLQLLDTHVSKIEKNPSWSLRVKVDTMVREAVSRLLNEAITGLEKELEDTERKG